MIEVNSKNFEKEVLKSNKKVLVDFFAEWCGPCKMVRPILEELSNTKKDVKFASINVDEEEDLAQEYGVMSIPCLIIFDGGKEVNRTVGFKSQEELESFLGE